MYVYVIQNRIGVLYIGMSWNPEKRLENHNKGKCAATKGLKWKLLHKWYIGDLRKALSFELFLQSKSRGEVLDLILDCPFFSSIFESDLPQVPYSVYRFHLKNYRKPMECYL